MSTDPSHTLATLDVNGTTFHYYSLPKAAETLGNIDKLPMTLKVLLENQLRYADDATVSEEDIQALADWLKEGKSTREIGYRPARVLMQDFTGVPGVVDLAAMRDAVKKLGAKAERINPLSPVDLVIDHSVMVDHFGDASAFKDNVAMEMERNLERYEFLRWVRKHSTISVSYRRAPASATRSTWSISARRSGPRRSTARPTPSPIPWSALTPTPP